MTTPTPTKGIADLPRPSTEVVDAITQRWNWLVSRLEGAVGYLRIERHGRWRVIPSEQGSMTGLAGQRVTVRLSAEQAAARKAARRLAAEDPAAYMRACSDDKP